MSISVNICCRLDGICYCFRCFRGRQFSYLNTHCAHCTLHASTRCYTVTSDVRNIEFNKTSNYCYTQFTKLWQI